MREYPVEIPESARQVKPNYVTRPSEAAVREIKNFISSTGLPHHWPGHTHTKPLEGSLIVYLAKFDLPDSCCGPLNRAKWAPCPCCHSESAWYCRNGMIAWFPNEAVIRIMGGQCFAKIDKTRHADAIKQFKREERARLDREYLLQNLDKVPVAIRAIEAALSPVSDIDNLRLVLAHRLTRVLNYDIWNAVRADGILNTHEIRTENFTRADGTSGTRDVSVLERYGTLAGYIIFDPSAKPIKTLLEKELEKLRKIDYGVNIASRIASM